MPWLGLSSSVIHREIVRKSLLIRELIDQSVVDSRRNRGKSAWNEWHRRLGKCRHRWQEESPACQLGNLGSPLRRKLRIGKRMVDTRGEARRRGEKENWRKTDVSTTPRFATSRVRHTATTSRDGFLRETKRLAGTSGDERPVV